MPSQPVDFSLSIFKADTAILSTNTGGFEKCAVLRSAITGVV